MRLPGYFVTKEGKLHHNKGNNFGLRCNIGREIQQFLYMQALLWSTYLFLSDNRHGTLNQQLPRRDFANYCSKGQSDLQTGMILRESILSLIKTAARATNITLVYEVKLKTIDGRYH